MMPKTEKERIIYMLSLCVLMTWTLGFINRAIDMQEISACVFWKVTKQEPVVFLFAFFIAMAGIQKFAVNVAYHFVSQTDSENAQILAVSFFMVTFMSPCVLIFRLLLNYGFRQNIFTLWINGWLRGYTIALFYQLLIAGPTARWILKKIREKR